MLRLDKTIRFNNGQVEENLKVGFYILQEDLSGCYLTQIATPEYKNLLGVNSRYEKLAISHIQKIDKGCGFIFSGSSGMGKTQLMKNIALKMNIPTIYVTHVVKVDQLVGIVQNINSDVIFIFDEFEKVFEEDSEQLLTFFDGVESTTKVYNFVAYNTPDISEYIINRPGRFVFNFKFGYVKTEEAISLFENVPEEYSKRLYKFLDMVHSLSYDIVFKIKNIIELHGYDSLEEIANVLNVITFDWLYYVEYYYVSDGQKVFHKNEIKLSRFYLESVPCFNTNQKRQYLGTVFIDLQDSLEDCVENYSKFQPVTNVYKGVDTMLHDLKFRIIKEKPIPNKEIRLVF